MFMACARVRTGGGVMTSHEQVECLLNTYLRDSRRLLDTSRFQDALAGLGPSSDPKVVLRIQRICAIFSQK